MEPFEFGDNVNGNKLLMERMKRLGIDDPFTFVSSLLERDLFLHHRPMTKEIIRELRMRTPIAI